MRFEQDETIGKRLKLRQERLETAGFLFQQQTLLIKLTEREKKRKKQPQNKMYTSS